MEELILPPAMFIGGKKVEPDYLTVDHVYLYSIGLGDLNFTSPT